MVDNSPAVLVDRLLTEVFNERDAARRRAVIEELCASDLVFVDPAGETRGLDAFEAKVSELLESGDPSFRFAGTHPSQEVGDVGVHRWQLGPVGGPAMVSGTDVVLVSAGLIASLYTVLD